MTFLNSLFGDMASNVWTVAIALLMVVVLIVFLAWVLKFVLNTSRGIRRGGNGRIGITEQIMVDGKRQIVLIRRDDVEHLILTGGPQDIVLEANIPLIAESVAVPSRRPVPPVPSVVEKSAKDQRPAGSAEPQVAASSRPSFAAASSAQIPSFERPQKAREPLSIPPLERLREIGKLPAERGAAALRYPGLLRPVTRHRGLPNKPAAPRADSDNTRPRSQERRGAVETDEKDSGGDNADTPTANRG